MKKFLLAFGCACIAFLLMVGSTVTRGQQPNSAPQLSFLRGEELFYEAEFKRALLRGLDVGEFRFSVRPQTTSSGRPSGDSLRLVGDVVSKGFFTKVAGFHFHQHVESTVDPGRFSALRTNKLDEQGKRVRISEAVFDHEKRKVTWTERDPNQNQPPLITSLDFAEPIQDVLSLIYFLRTQRLEVGKSFEIPVSDAGRVFSLPVAVVERKRIKCILGLVEAVRVEPAMFGEGRMLNREGKLSIWITEDNRHLPVWAQLKLNLGTVDIKLKRVSYPEMIATR